MKKAPFLILAAFLALSAHATLTSVKATSTQRYPWNGLIDIDYEIASDNPLEDVFVSVSCRDKDRNASIPVKTISGEGAQSEVRTGAHRLTWDAAADSPVPASSAFSVELCAVSTNNLYMVVDLQGGTNAVEYPVTYLSAVPEGGWSDEYKSTKLVLRLVQPGTFVMGSPSSELGHDWTGRGREQQHQVTLTKPFYIGVFEITQKQWSLIVGTDPSASKGDLRPVESVCYNDICGANLGSRWPQDNLVDEDSFMGRMRSRTGRLFDLPTEAQWEYACRAGTTTALNSGKNLTNTYKCPNMDEVGCYCGNSSDPIGGYTSGTDNVGSYLQNNWGLYDMHGNVFEWCRDWWQDAMSADSVTDPLGPSSSIYGRIRRGGCWREDWTTGYAAACRSGHHGIENPPGYKNAENGLRVICCLDDMATTTVLRYDCRTNYPGRLVRGVVPMGTPDGGPVVNWDTTALEDGWNTYAQGSTNAELVVLNAPAVTIEEGRISADTIWDDSTTHLLRGNVYISSGATLFVTTNAVVKFCEGTKILIESGAKMRVIGAENADVIFTAANDNSVGAVIPGLDEKAALSFEGIVLGSASGSSYTDNNYIQTRGFSTTIFPTLALHDAVVNRDRGTAYVEASVSGTRRNQSFSIDWEVSGGELGKDYTLASGTLTWANSQQGSKWIEIPVNTERTHELSRPFSVRITAAHGGNGYGSTATVDLCELGESPTTVLTESSAAQSAETRLEMRSPYVGLDVQDESKIDVVGGRLCENAVWTNACTYFVLNTIYVPAGVTLTIREGAVVKFAEGAKIRIESGGTLNVVGAAGQDVFFTAANDTTVGAVVAGLDPETAITGFGFSIISGTTGRFTDNGYLQTRGFESSFFPTLSVCSAVADRLKGTAYVAVTPSGTTRNQSFSLDWQVSGGEMGTDYLVEGGTLAWSRSSEGVKWIPIAVNTDRTGEASRTFTLRLTACRGANGYGADAQVDLREYVVSEVKGDFMAVNGRSEAVPVREDIGAQPVLPTTHEPIRYSGRWGEDAGTPILELVARAQARELVRGTNGEEGVYTLDIDALDAGRYQLRNVICDKAGERAIAYERDFLVADAETTALHRGTISTQEVWSADKVHLVVEDVTVASGGSLTIASGAIVKMMPGTRLTIASGGSGICADVLFTHAYDGSVGGDTFACADEYRPKSGEYSIDGSWTSSNLTEYRYCAPIALDGTLTADTHCQGFRTYFVSTDVTVPSGVRLTIDAGAEIKFASGKSLTVASGGVLDASAGTRAAPIVFMSADDDPLPGDWRRIVVAGTASFANCRILYASDGNGDDGAGTCDAMTVNGGCVTFVDSSILHGGKYAVGLESGHFYMTNSVIADCYCAFRHWPSDEIVNSVIYDCDRLSNNAGQKFRNCIFSGMTEAWRWNDGVNAYNYCVAWNPEDYGLQDPPQEFASGLGNQWADPQFDNPDDEDFRVAETSPCIDGADTLAAPRLDHYGQSRQNAAPMPTGVANEKGRYADIGLGEVMPRGAASDIDLAIEDVTAPAAMTVGETATISWTVRNIGTETAEGQWRDAVELVCANGKIVTVMTHYSTARIAANTAYAFSASFAVPSAVDGEVVLRVTVNANRDIPEGTLYANNRAEASPSVLSAAALAFDEDESGTATLSEEGSSGGNVGTRLPDGGLLIIRATDNETDCLLGLSGNGRLPSKTDFAYSSVYVGNGTYLLAVPAGGDAHVSFENLVADELAITYAIAARGLYLYDGGLTSCGNTGSATVQIHGYGFCEGMTATAVCGSSRIAATNVEVSDVTTASVTFNMKGAEPGTYAVEISDGATTVSVPCLNVVKSTIGPKFRTWVDIPTTLRNGRTYTGTLYYANEGDEEMDAEYIRLESTPRVSFVMANGAMADGGFELLAVSQTKPYDKLKPGERVAVPFQFDSGSTLTELKMNVRSEFKTDLIFDWDGLSARGRPWYMDEETWGLVYGYLREKLGETWGTRIAALRKNAAQSNSPIADRQNVGGKWQSFTDEAMGVDRILPIVGATVDLSRPCRGMNLCFVRAYGTALNARRRKGALGVGWATCWHATLRQNGAGVNLTDGFGCSELFTRNEETGVWTADDQESGAKLEEAASAWRLTTMEGVMYLYDKVIGQLESISDHYGNKIAFTYDANTNLTRAVHSDGPYIDLSVDAEGRIVRITDDLGRQVAYAYDGDGHLASVVRADGTVDEYGYLPNAVNRTGGALNSMARTGQATCNLTWDDLGRVNGVAENGSFHFWEIVRDDLNHAVTFVAPDGAQTVISATSTEGVYQIVDPLGRVLRQTETENGRHIVTQYPSGRREIDRLNDKKQVVSHVNGLGGETQFVHSDINSELSAFTDAKGRTSTFAYDAGGGIVRIDRPDGSKRTIERNERGDATRFTNARGQAVNYSRDGRGRLVRATMPDGRTVDCAYDAHGNLTEVVDSWLGTKTLGYDANDRLIRFEQPGGHVYTLTRDAAGRVVSIMNERGLGWKATYDVFGRLASLVDGENASLAAFEYDATTSRQTGIVYGNGVRMGLNADIAGTVTNITYTKDAASLESFTADYNADGLPIAERASVSDHNAQYVYDADQQLINWSGENESESYVYDATGNRTRAGSTQYALDTQMNRVVSSSNSDGAARYEYDADGNLIYRRTDDDVLHYSYDVFNRLVAATNEAGTVKWSCVYDAFGEMVRIDDNGAVTQRVFLPGLNGLTDEYDGNNQFVRHHYVLNRFRLAVETAVGRRYLHGDFIGSVRLVTDDDAQVVGRAAYHPFGRCLATSGDASLCGWIGLLGVEYQSAPNLHWMCFRHYSAELGRFIQTDPLDAFSDEFNLYRYVGNSPLAFIDPLGLKSDDSPCDEKTVGFQAWVKKLLYDLARTQPAGMAANIIEWNYFVNPCPNPIAGFIASKAFNFGVSQVVLMTGDLYRWFLGQPIFNTVNNLTANRDSIYDEMGMPDMKSSNTKWGKEAHKIYTGSYDSLLFKFLDWLVHGDKKNTESVPNPNDPCAGENKNTKIGASSRTLKSIDPNEIVGSEGKGDEKYVAPGERLRYTIYFENKSTASAAACTVRITLPMDAALDWSTLELGEVAFGSHVDTGLSGKASGSSEFDLDDGSGWSVRTKVAASGDSVVWDLRIWDPSTSDHFPEDASAGFLPPNDATHRGEGHVCYSVCVKAGSEALVPVEAGASIVFDTNAAIQTEPGWTNVLGRVVCVGSGKTADVLFDPKWVKKRTGEGASAEQIAASMNATGANGLKVWQSAALGFNPDDADETLRIDVPQNKDAGLVRVDLQAGHATTGCWPKVSYRMDRAGGAQISDTQSGGSFDIRIDGDEDPTGHYRFSALFADDDGAAFSEAVATNELGILRRAMTNQCEIAPVPWKRVSVENGDIVVSNLVKTAGLSADDRLHVYDDASKRYVTWELQSDKTWKPIKTAKAIDGQIEVLTAGSPEVATVKRGSGVWLVRQDTSKPLALVGQREATGSVTTIAAGTTTQPKWTLLASPAITNWNLNAISEGVGATDRIVVPMGAKSRTYTRDATSAKWGYMSDASATRIEDDTEIAPGTGFWYVSEGGSPTIKW